MPLAAIKQIILNIFFFSCKKISTIWEYVEEKVYRKFEIKLKLTVNDVLFGYKGHSQHSTMILFVNHLVFVAKKKESVLEYLSIIHY